MREILILVGVAIIAAIFFDGFRRMYRNRQRALRVSLEKVEFEAGFDPNRFELPRPARVVPRAGSAEEMDGGAEEPVTAMSRSGVTAGQSSTGRASASKTSTALADDSHVPVLVDVVSGQQVATPVQQADLFAEDAPPSTDHIRRQAEALYGTSSVSRETAAPTAVPRPVAKKPVAAGAPAARATQLDITSVGGNGPAEEVFAFHVVSRSGQRFSGDAMLQLLLELGLRYGEMRIFHRHEQATGQGKILFSMTNVEKPGHFDLQTMADSDFRGVSFFLALPGHDSLRSFDTLIETARRLAEALEGELLDQSRSVATRQTIEHYRERVVDFERKRLSARV